MIYNMICVGTLIFVRPASLPEPARLQRSSSLTEQPRVELLGRHRSKSFEPPRKPEG